MAKKNRYEGMSQQEIDALKAEKKVTMIAAVFFMFLIFAGIILSTTNACNWYTDEELGLVSATSVADVQE